MADSCQIMFIVFSKAHARIQNDLAVLDARALGNGQGIPHILTQIAQKVMIFRLFAVMHQDTGHLILGNQVRHLPVIFQPPNIVDQVGARFQGRFHHRTFIAVD